MAHAAVFMGVAGSGKTTIGKETATRLGWTFLDADDFHPLANIEKMKQKIPLTDEDREPWLLRLHTVLNEYLARNESAILACSALKETYRDVLRAHLPQIHFVFLDIDAATIKDRLQHRTAHFFPKELLDSQFRTLEIPHDAIVVDARKPLEEVVDQAVDLLKKL